MVDLLALLELGDLAAQQGPPVQVVVEVMSVEHQAAEALQKILVEPLKALVAQEASALLQENKLASLAALQVIQAP